MVINKFDLDFDQEFMSGDNVLLKKTYDMVTGSNAIVLNISKFRSKFRLKDRFDYLSEIGKSRKELDKVMVYI